MAVHTDQAVDVRDMLCAQALAVVSQLIERVAVRAKVTVQYNSEDVKRDLMIWATDQGHRVRAGRSETLEIERH